MSREKTKFVIVAVGDAHPLVEKQGLALAEYMNRKYWGNRGFSFDISTLELIVEADPHTYNEVDQILYKAEAEAFLVGYRRGFVTGARFERIQQAVDRALDNAVANGYSQFLLEDAEVTSNVVGFDMVERDPEIESIVVNDLDDDAGKLVPFIEDWKRRQHNRRQPT